MHARGGSRMFERSGISFLTAELSLLQDVMGKRAIGLSLCLGLAIHVRAGLKNDC